MDLSIPKPGTYVIAVSGGVDSMVLLHILQSRPGYKFVVAHFDHGIRPDSTEDRKLVQAKARQHKLAFVYEEGKLGAGTSEAQARTARYRFLRQVQAASGAHAIITAHHQDDVLETAIFNLLRGTGRKGLTALRTRHDLIRPLLDVPKQDIVDFARRHDVQWREDPTNQDLGYQRNYIRHRIVPRLDAEARARLWQVINDLRFTNEELDRLLVTQLHLQSAAGTLDREYFVSLPHNVSREVMAAWLREHGVPASSARTLDRLVVAAKTGKRGQQFDVEGGVQMLLADDQLALQGFER